MTIDVEAVYIDIESFYLFKMGVRKEGAPASDGGRRSSFRALSATDRKATRKHGDSLLFRLALINSAFQLRHVYPSVRTYSAAPGGQIFAKSGTGGGCDENMSSNSKFG